MNTFSKKLIAVIVATITLFSLTTVAHAASWELATWKKTGTAASISTYVEETVNSASPSPYSHYIAHTVCKVDNTQTGLRTVTKCVMVETLYGLDSAGVGHTMSHTYTFQPPVLGKSYAFAYTDTNWIYTVYSGWAEVKVTTYYIEIPTGGGSPVERSYTTTTGKMPF